MFVNQNILDQSNFGFGRESNIDKNSRMRIKNIITNKRAANSYITNSRNLNINPDISFNNSSSKVYLKYKSGENKSIQRIKKIRELTLEEKKINKFYYKKIYRYEYINSICSLVSIILSIAHYEFTYGLNDAEKLKLFSTILYFVSITTFILWINFYFYELTLLNYKIDTKRASENDTIFSTNHHIRLIINILISFLHPNPLFEGKIYSTYNSNFKVNVLRSINSILLIFVFFRIYFIIRYLMYAMDYMGPETQEICRKFYFKRNILFSMKSLMKENPFRLYLILMISLLFFFSLSLRILDRELKDDNYDYYLNMLWFVVITNSTIGYGDVNVRTFEARFLAMISCLLGLFMISFGLLTLSNFLSFNRIEASQFRILERTELIDKNRKDAKNLISNFCLASIKNNKLVRQNIKAKKHEINYLVDSIYNFKESSDEILNSDKIDSNQPLFILQSKLNMIENNYDDLIKNNNKTIKELENIISKLNKIYYDLLN